jgi:hypothetical protein
MTPLKGKAKTEYQRTLMRQRRSTPIKVCPNCKASYQGHSCPNCKQGKGKVLEFGI